MNYFYVGQTIDIGQRIKQHIVDYLQFIIFKKFTSVSIHFNLKNHIFIQHFSFYVINSKMNDKNKIPDKKYLKFNKIGDFQ